MKMQPAAAWRSMCWVGLCLISTGISAASSYPLVPLADGRWEVFAVPVPWLKAHWQGAPIDALYIALLSPDAQAVVEDVGPCFAPARLVAVMTRRGREPTQMQLEKYDFCGKSPRSQGSAPWPAGPGVFVEGIAVRVTETGQIEVERSFRRHRADPYPLTNDPATFPLPAGGERVTAVRVWPLQDLYPAPR